MYSLPPLGCLPMQRTVNGGTERDCAESVNQGAMLYNSKLSSSMIALQKELPDARLVYLEIYEDLNDIIQHFDQFGKTLHLY